MAFLDNSGDIILDAVLTDTGRLRLAQGDGSFKIAKFALADDEINYGLFNSSHSSGSAYYDLEVLQTPVLEAFTNNTSNMKSRLVSFSRTNILYMPILKLNKEGSSTNDNVHQGLAHTYYRQDPSADLTSPNTATDAGRFYVAVDAQTYNILSTTRVAATSANNFYDTAIEANTSGRLTGVIQGYRNNVSLGSKIPFTDADQIRVDQGLDTNEIAPAVGLDGDMLETAYILELDYRLGRLKEAATDNMASVNFIDDDNIASYYVTAGGSYVNPTGNNTISNPSNPWGFTTNNAASLGSEDLSAASDPQVFEGPRGSVLGFRINSSLELNSSTYLFDQIGFSENITDTDGSTTLGLDKDDPAISGKTAYYIDSTVRVTGANTGYILDIPIRYVKIK